MRRARHQSLLWMPHDITVVADSCWLDNGVRQLRASAVCTDVLLRCNSNNDENLDLAPTICLALTTPATGYPS